MPRSVLIWSGRGGRSRRRLSCERPPRLRRQGGIRRNFLDAAATPLKELDVMRVLPQLSSPFVLRTFLVSGNVVVDYAFQVSQRRFRQKAAESSRGDKRSEP